MRCGKFTSLLLLLAVASFGATAVHGQITYELMASQTETSYTGSGYTLNSYWHDCRNELLYLASDLTTAGVPGGGQVSAIAFKCSQLPGKNLENLRIRMKHTTASTVTSTYQSGYQNCYGPTTLTPSAFTVNGWYTFTFTTPFIWNGTDNIIIDYSIDGNSWVSGGGSYQKTVGTARQNYGYSDSGYTYPFNGMEYGTRTFVPSLRITFDGLAVTTPALLASAAELTPYSTDIQASQGTQPYNWSLQGGALPAGLSIAQASTGNGNVFRVSGTPQSGSAGNYSFTVRVTDAVSDTYDKLMQLYVMPQPASMPFADDFSTDTGWQLGTGWQRGAATAFTGNTSTGPTRTEPGTDNSPSSDNNILGHQIGADYANNLPISYATSPPVNCTSATTVHLRFYRWLGVNSGDWAKIEVTNNGSTWTDVYTNNGTVGSNTPSQWESIAYDISAVAAGNGVVQVRFQLGSTDTSIVNVGWCIDDFEILDPGPPLVVEEGGSPGTVITDNEPPGGLRDWGIINTSTNSSILTVAFTNNGISPITFGAYSKTGNNPNEFYVIKQITTNPLPVGQTDTMEFQFNSANAGVYTCTINVPHNVAAGAGTSPFEINLRAEAVVPIPDLEVHEGTATGPIIAHNQSATGTVRDFGNQDINAGPTASIDITIVNGGTGNLGLSTPDMGGTWWNQFVVTVPGTFPSSLAPAAAATFQVAFDPTSTGVKDAFVRIAHTDGSKPSPYQVPVLGNGTNSSTGAFGASDSGGGLSHNDPATGPRDFGNVLVATISNPITITISNNGGAAITIGMPVLGGANPGEFALDTTGYTNPSLPAASSTSFDVTFEPTSVGQKDATISITHNDTTVTSPFIINVTGNGVTTSPTASVHIGNAAGPALANPAPATGALDFGIQDVNAGPTAAVTIFVQNTGTAPLTVGAPAFNPATTEFQLQNAGGFAQTLAIGANATFDIVFDPTTVGVQSAVVQFTHNDAATGSPFVINVTGQAVLNAPLIDVHESTVTGATVASGAPALLGGGRDFGNQDVSAGPTTPITIVIVNQGTLDLNLGAPALAGTNAGAFVLNTTGYNNVVTPGNNTSFQITFDPALGGMKDAQVEFTQDDPTQPTPYVVLIRGTAIDPTGVQISTSTLPATTAGEPYPPTQLQAIQGSAPYTWSVYSGSMPAGLNLSPTGLLDGTASGFGGSFKVTIRVTDNTNATHEREFTVAVAGNLSGSGRASSGGCAAGGDSHAAVWLIGLFVLVAGGVRFRKRKSA